MSTPSSAGRVLRWQAAHPYLADAAIAVVVLVLNVFMGLWPLRQAQIPSLHSWLPLTLAACLVCALALVFRRRHLTVSWAVLTFLPLAHEAVVARGFPDMGVAEIGYAADALRAFTLLGLPFALATLALHHRAAWVWAACAVSTLTTVFGQAALGGYAVDTLGGLLMPYGLINIIGVLVGVVIRAQETQLHEAELRSARLMLAREQEAALAAANERSRIAREMHDVVAHSLAVMITLADGAATAIDRNPAMAKEALTTLAETGRSALADTRRLVGVLREDPVASPAARDDADTRPVPAARRAPAESTGADTSTTARESAVVEPPAAAGTTVRELPVPEFAPPGTVAPVEPSQPIADLRRQATDVDADASRGQTPLAPAPEQADLEVLVERFRTAGVPVTYRWTGRRLPADKGLQLTLFRIAQEALTNVLRYAPTTRSVAVAVDRHAGTAVLTIDNDAAPGSTPLHGSGKGLIGMRERAAVYGGTVQAGPTPTGWRVRAVLHWDDSLEDNDEGTAPWQMPQ
ncbi:sensor histidine kinase [Actinomyces glycerinitolerans]|uniref:histidine kinase n=1 Tax=Actinomyces glycerinitolerans TaxID=1892869 RepID=A0A1M4RXN1_9ACTO|nr:histidine kinase [Actinomyces glycerinitolerans]SHE24691.1 histidine kinase [Actinomyces glycerinitolerans]